jgi:2,5-diamino-6-(ribosylamino)-4(3H)-pyrimidinone 5'-phosphate reductase
VGGPSRSGGPRERPEVWVNCAASVDGRIAYAAGARARLSSPEDLVRVHRLRAEVDGIVVGVGTVVADDPSLHVRWELTGSPPGRPLTRIVIDGSGRTPEGARVLDTTAPTIVATTVGAAREYPHHVRTVRAGEELVDLAEVFEALHRLGLRRLLVEGGASLLASVLRSGLFDRFTVYYAPLLIGGATATPMVAGAESRGPADTAGLDLVGVERVGEGYVASYRPRGRPSPGAPAPGAGR